MTENELKELNERLAKAVGIKKYSGNFPEAQGIALWKLPGSFGFYDTCPDFTASMDACIKWIVPGVDLEVRIQMTLTALTWVVDFQDAVREKWSTGADKLLPLAFCLAADKYFKEANHV